MIKFFVCLAEMFSAGSVSINEIFEFVFMFDIFCSPKLNNSIVFSVSVFVNASTKSKSGLYFKSS